MSTPLTLTVGDLTLTYNTMHMGMDHGMLFQEQDRTRRREESSDYARNDAQPDEDDDTQSEMCFCLTLGAMLPRLELLGYTLGAAKADYDRHAAQELERRADEDDSQETGRSAPWDFNRFIAFIREHAVSDLSDEFEPDYDGSNGRATRGRFADDPAIDQLPLGEPWRDRGGYSERSHLGNLIGFLDPYSTLRVLAENPANLGLEVVWDYGAFVDAGWADNGDFVAGARRTQTYLIATEGTSDTHILRRALTLLRPDIQDFFRFIDVEDRHPFSGTGNLAKFAEGLVKIDVHNRVVFLFDNDAEGREAYHSLRRFPFPTNMRAMVLPDLDELRNFPARGPDGVSSVDINGRAAAIECYLDLRLRNRGPAQVTWTNYKRELDAYQGSLDFKEAYAREFYAAKAESIASGDYDASKLRVVLDTLLRECKDMAERMLRTRWRTD